MLCLDHPEVQAIIPRIRDRRIITYGFSAQADVRGTNVTPGPDGNRSEEHTSELQSLMRISYAVFCLKKKNHKKPHTRPENKNNINSIDTNIQRADKAPNTH